MPRDHFYGELIIIGLEESRPNVETSLSLKTDLPTSYTFNRVLSVLHLLTSKIKVRTILISNKFRTV